MSIRFLRCDATHLSSEDLQDIINARNTMKGTAVAIAQKYHISTRRVYQIWRNKHPQIDNTYIVNLSHTKKVSKGGKKSESISIPVNSNDESLNQNLVSKQKIRKKHETASLPKYSSSSIQKKQYATNSDLNDLFNQAIDMSEVNLSH